MRRLLRTLFSHPVWYTECRALLAQDRRELNTLFEYFDQFNIGSDRAARHQHIVVSNRDIANNLRRRIESNPYSARALRRRMEARYTEGTRIREILDTISDAELVETFIQHKENTGRKREVACETSLKSQ